MKRLLSFRRGTRLMLGLCLALLVFGSQQACLPGPTTLQVERVINCGDATSAITTGIFDVSVVDTYFMRVSLINNLAITANSGQFKPEVNFVDLREIKVWFEYPQSFSQQGLGSAALYTQENPLIRPLSATLRPTLQADFAGLVQGAGGGTAPTGENVSFYLIPTELSRIWVQASELNATALTNQSAERKVGPTFEVIAHVTISGITRAAQLVATPEFLFPIRVCKGCLDQTKKNNSTPTFCSGGGNAGAAGINCSGQDGICLTNQGNQNP